MPNEQTTAPDVAPSKPLSPGDRLIVAALETFLWGTLGWVIGPPVFFNKFLKYPWWMGAYLTTAVFSFLALLIFCAVKRREHNSAAWRVAYSLISAGFILLILFCAVFSAPAIM